MAEFKTRSELEEMTCEQLADYKAEIDTGDELYPTTPLDPRTPASLVTLRFQAVSLVNSVMREKSC